MTSSVDISYMRFAWLPRPDAFGRWFWLSPYWKARVCEALPLGVSWSWLIVQRTSDLIEFGED